MNNVSGNTFAMTSPKDHQPSRLTNFRDKLAEDNLKRHEIYISAKTKDDIKSIAAKEGLSQGVAAEALLKLGIETFHDRGGLSGAPVEGVASAAAKAGYALPQIQTFDRALSVSPQAFFATGKNDPMLRQWGPANVASHEALGHGKALASYSDRSELKVMLRPGDGPSEVATKTASVTENLISKIRSAQKRKGK